MDTTIIPRSLPSSVLSFAVTTTLVHSSTAAAAARLASIASSISINSIDTYNIYHGSHFGDTTINTTTITTTTLDGQPTNTSELPVLTRSGTETVILTLILGVIILLTVTGNLLVIVSIIVNVHLRTTTNYFIVNLAIADLLLGTTVLPFSATLEVLQYWVFGQIFCDVWAAIDVLCCTASILSLCVISIDRYIGVTRPLQHPSIVRRTRAVCVILGVWLLSFITSVAPLIGWKEEPDPNPRICTVTTHTGYVLFSTALSFYIPCLIILLVYFRIYRETVKYTKCIAAGAKMTKVDEDNSVALRIHTGGSSNTTIFNKTQTSSTSPKSQRLFNNSNNRSQHYHHYQSRLPTGQRNGCGNGKRAGTLDAHTGSGHSLITSSSPQFYPVDKETRTNNNTRRSKKGSGIASSRVNFSSRVAKFKREKKAAKTLGIVVGVFITCWLPFFFALPLQSLCQRCEIPPLLFKLFFWLGYCNSTMNPIIYTCSSTEFRRAFLDILCCRKCRRQQQQTVSVSTRLNIRGNPHTNGSRKTKQLKGSHTSHELTISKNGNQTVCKQSYDLGTNNRSKSSRSYRFHNSGSCNKDHLSIRHNNPAHTVQSAFVCQQCNAVCQMSSNADLYSTTYVGNHNISCTLARKTSLSPQSKSEFPDSAQYVSCVCCQTVHPKDTMISLPEETSGRNRLPSSSDISMASLSCHSSSPVSTS